MAYISHATNELEDKVRQFEIDVLINPVQANKDKSHHFEKGFSSIYSQICYDSDLFQGRNQDKLERFILTNFNAKMVEFVTSHEYFKFNQESEFNMRKIRILFFLLTFSSNTSNCPDKVFK